MNYPNFFDPSGKLLMPLDASEPIQWTAVGSLDANGNGFLKMGKEMMTIHADGRITVSEDASPTETAKLVLEAMQEILQGMLDREYQRGVEVYRKAADDLAAENKLLRDNCDHVNGVGK